VLNQLPDTALAFGNDLRTQVTNPFLGQILSGSLSQRTVSRAQLLRPFPHFAAVTSTAAGWAASTYHALEAKVEKRYAKGLTVLLSYTYSKLMDVAAGGFSGESLSSDVIQDWNNLEAERSVSTLDQTHRFLINGVYELPFGKQFRQPASALLAGWEVGAILSVFTGRPLGVTSATHNTL